MYLLCKQTLLKLSIIFFINTTQKINTQITKLLHTQNYATTLLHKYIFIIPVCNCEITTFFTRYFQEESVLLFERLYINDC